LCIVIAKFVNNFILMLILVYGWSKIMFSPQKSEIDSLDEGGLKLPKVTGEITFENIHFEYPSRADVPVSGCEGW
jgi:ABC-type bacteriocin/lantibiotic exporter with double-glycine peptidase domain